MVLENRLIKSYEFLRLRADNMLNEIRVYADIMLNTLKRWVPMLTMPLWIIELEN